MGDIERTNVIVVGAGASKEFGLPTGAELKSKIASIVDIRFDEWGSKLVSGDYRLVDSLRRLVALENNGNTNVNEYLYAAWRIRDNMPLAPSIDNFLDTHHDQDKIIFMGKVAITKAILESEANCLLRNVDRNSSVNLNSDDLQNTWIAQFFRILVSQRDFDSFLNALRGITFISFNYDRCVHQFFVLAAKQYFGLTVQQALEVQEALKILYPYGSVGEFELKGETSNFGDEVHGERLLGFAKNIRTFTEGTGSIEVTEMNAAFSEADVVMFLGFGFLKLNMNLLFEGRVYSGPKVLATGKGMSNHSRGQVVAELDEIFPALPRFDQVGNMLSIVEVIDGTCAELVFEFHRLLSA